MNPPNLTPKNATTTVESPELAQAPAPRSRHTAVPHANGRIGADGKCWFEEAHYFNVNAGTRFIQFFEGKKQPAAGARPRRTWEVPPLSSWDWVLQKSRFCTDGFCLVVSSTGPTYTEAADEAIMELTYSRE